MLSVEKINLKKIFVIGTITASSLFLTACTNNIQNQNTQNSNNNENSAQNDNIKLGGFSFFGSDNNVGNNVEVGEKLSDIKTFLKSKLNGEVNELIKGAKIPLIMELEYYVYESPNQGNNLFNAGTSINEEKAIIKFSKGGSSDLEIDNFKNSYSLGLGQLSPDPKENRVIPYYTSIELGNLLFNGEAEMLNKRLIINICYPVYKKDQFKLEVPNSNELNTITKGKVKIKPNSGEIKYNLKYIGSKDGDKNYKYTITLAVKKDNNAIEITPEDFNECGSVPKNNPSKIPTIYIRINKLSEEGMDINCKGAEKEGEFYKVRLYNNEGKITCTIEGVTLDTTEKELPFEIESIYTAVKTLESEKIKIIK